MGLVSEGQAGPAPGPGQQHGEGLVPATCGAPCLRSIRQLPTGL